MRIHTKQLQSRGDTIVEVLIVVAVLSMAFAISYATATQALTKSRNSQEHSAALGAINAQVELLRSAYSNKVSGIPATSGQYFCMAGPGVIKALPAVPSDPTTDTLTSPNPYPPECVKNGMYIMSVTYDSTLKSYLFRARWPGVGALGVQQEELNYRIYDLTASGASGFSDPANLGGGSGGGGGSSSNFIWSNTGAPWGTCTPNEPVIGDPYDGCKAAATSMIAFRQVIVDYSLVPGPPITTGSASLVINYNQNNSWGMSPPPSYGAFRLDVSITDSSGTHALGTMSLGIPSDSSSWSPRDSSAYSVNIPGDNPSKITFTWTNNLTIAGGDANLQINSISLSRP